MKRLLCLIAALCLALVLTACNQATAPNQLSGTAQSTGEPHTDSTASADPLTDLFRQEGVTWAGCTGETAATFDLEDGRLTIVTVAATAQADGSESYGSRQQRSAAAWDEQVLCTLGHDSALPGLLFDWELAADGEMTCLDLTLRYDAGADGDGAFCLKEGQTLRLYPMEFPAADESAGSSSAPLSSATADQLAFIRLAELYLQRRRTEAPAADDLSSLLKLYRGSTTVQTFMGNGLDPAPENRAALAAAVGIPNYTGNKAQDEQLLIALGAPAELTPLT